MDVFDMLAEDQDRRRADDDRRLTNALRLPPQFWPDGAPDTGGTRFPWEGPFGAWPSAPPATPKRPSRVDELASNVTQTLQIVGAFAIGFVVGRVVR